MATPIDGPRSPRPVRGFTLIEIVVVLFILGVVVAMAAAVTTALTASQRLSTTTTRMAAIDAAIVQFVMQQKRLPCPADITRVSTDPLYGKGEIPDDVTGCPGSAATQEKNGVVPWIDLGLTQTEVTDGWGRLFTFRVSPTLAAKNGMDMSWCDPAGTSVAVNLSGFAPGACDPTCIPTSTSPFLQNCTSPTNFLSAGTGKGLIVKNVAGSQIMAPPSTGAGYVLISHGQSGGHGYLPNGQLFAGTTTDGIEEKKNYADSPLGGYYVDDSISDGGGATHFDDLLSHPSVLTIINKAGLAPRSHHTS